LAKWTPIYGSQDASLDIRNGLLAVQWFSGAAECQLPASRLKFDQADGQFLFEPHLLVQYDTITLSLQLTHNTVRIGDTRGGGFSLSIG
jgi:hypothetical protein